MDTSKLTKETLGKFFDHTLLKPFATEADLRELCRQAKEINAAMVAINSYPVAICKKELEGTDIHVGAAIGFPLGQTTVETKVFEVEDSIKNGADEIDYVLNIGKVKEGNWAYIKDEMERIVKVCKEAGILSKVIFENCYLTKEEIRQCALIAKEVKPDFIKTSTGFGTGGATFEDVEIMINAVEGEVKVKAAGGVRDWATCKKMIELGCERIGTSSAYAILEGFEAERKGC